MPGTAAALILGAALVHATWNLLLKGAKDGALAITMAAIGGAVIAFPVSLLFGTVPSEALPYLGVSICLQAGYYTALAAAYRRTDISTAYPIARGLGPLLAAVGGAVFLGDSISAAGWVGVAIVVSGIGLIALSNRRFQGVAFALVTGLFIGAYTVVDTAGVRVAGSGFVYTATLYAGLAVVMVPLLYARRGAAGIRQIVSLEGAGLMILGVLGVVAYSMVLAAARIAPIGLVAPSREIAIVFGVVGGRLFFSEPVGWRRGIGALVTVVGVAVLLTR
jgi:drug/metabolite transporter (DMT)-like permease